MKFVVPLICVLLLSMGGSARADQQSAAQTERIQQLIQQLGAKSYGLRKHAETQLQYLGHEAMELLLEAQYHESSEVSLAAQQLLGRLNVAWAQDGDRPITHDITRDYALQPLLTKRSRATWLARLEDGVGYKPLCRIVRYEPSELIAKHAALGLMKAMDPEEPDQIAAMSDAVTTILDGSNRRPAEWLRVFAQSYDHSNLNSLEAWKRLVEEERSLSASRTTSEITADLTQQLADRLLATDRNDELRDVIRQLVELRKDDADGILQISHWLLDHDLTSLFEDLVWEPFEELKATNPAFVYCGAEAFLSDKQRSQQIAEQAYALSEDDTQFPDLWAKAAVRFNTGYALERRGQTEWTIREYQRLLGMEDQWQLAKIKQDVATQLGELLHDRGRDDEAADVLEKNPKRGTGIFDDEGSDSGTRARMYYFRSEHYRKQNDRVRQQEFLEKAIAVDPTDADVLIAMHRLPRASAEWQADTQQKIGEAVAGFEKQLRRLRGAGEIENLGPVAMNLNQLAWLVGNTSKNNDQVVQQSWRSLELRPHAAGYLDTLGRTYYSVGDLNSAIKYQRRAARLEPHSQQIQRQLQLFEKAKREAEQREAN